MLRANLGKGAEIFATIGTTSPFSDSHLLDTMDYSTEATYKSMILWYHLLRCHLFRLGPTAAPDMMQMGDGWSTAPTYYSLKQEFIMGSICSSWLL